MRGPFSKVQGMRAGLPSLGLGMGSVCLLGPLKTKGLTLVFVGRQRSVAIPVEAFGHHSPGFESFRGSFPAPLTSLLQAFSSYPSRKWCREGHLTSCMPGYFMLQAREEKTLVLSNSMLVEKRDQNPRPHLHCQYS